MSQVPRLASFVAAIVLVASISGCGTGDIAGETSTSMNPDQDAQTEKELRAKPSLEAAQAEYKAAVTTMADGIAALTPGTTWQFAQDTWTGCSGTYGAAKAKQAYVLAAFSGPIPDAVWPKALQIAKDGAAPFGATEYGTFKDHPGDHDIYLAGSDGVEFRLGTKGASTLMGQSDCRLNEADRE
jgi:predicted LppA-like lipoprotein